MSLDMYEVFIIDPAGGRVAGPLTEIGRLEWSQVLGNVGVAYIELNAGDWSDGWFSDRLLLQIWRQPRFQAGPQLLGWYWMLDHGKRSEGDVPISWVRGYDLNAMLTWRIVAGYAGSDEAVKTGDACQIMWEYVEEALLTDAGRDISEDFDFTGEGLTGGATITYTASRGRLLSVLTGCANASGAEMPGRVGVPVRFWVRATETGGVLRIVERPWGGDLRGGQPLSPEFGTLFAPRWEYRGGGAETYGYIGGQGQVENRTVVEVDLSDGTPLGRREMWTENSQISVPASLENWGAARLYDRRARLLAAGELRDTEKTAFGRDWALGDWVMCEYDGKQFEAEVLAVTGRVTAEGELIRARVEGEIDLETLGAPEGGNGGNGID